MPDRDEPRTDAVGVETTIDLVLRVQAGDRIALEQVCARYLVPLRRWARNRLPRKARSLLDTEDIVQDTLIRTVRNLDAFDPARAGGLHAYMRTALDNRMRDEIRRAARTPEGSEVSDRQVDPKGSPLERAIGRQALERYETALARLDPDVREAVIARVEFGLSYQEIADALGGVTANTIRMRVSRALARMAHTVGDDER
jgi:RNA polymerase sigma-70 factor (ECF subfamily)